MYSAQFKAFMERHKIKSPGEWEKVTGISKSTITRGLKGNGKDIGVNTILELITPYGETADQFLAIGEYSEEAQAKNEIVEKIENTIDEIENSSAIPEDTANDIKETLEVAQHHIENEPKNNKLCPECASLYKIIDYLENSNATKSKVIFNLFKISVIQLVILVVLIVSDAVLIMALINALNN